MTLNWAVSKHPVNSVKPLRGNTEPRQRNTREGVETRHGTSLKCTACGSLKPAHEFYKKDKKGRLDRTCKSCRIIDQRQRTLGITEAEYRALYHKQSGQCGICKRRIYSKRYKNLAVDHCHSTGRIRGLLCNNCNTGLGLFRDDPAALRRAADWAEGIVQSSEQSEN